MSKLDGVQSDLISIRFLMGGIVLTVAVLGVHMMLPARTLDLLEPGVSKHFLQAPPQAGEETAVQWVDAERLRWRCQYVASEKYQPCVLTYLLTGDDLSRGRDLSGFDHIELELDYQGPAPFLHLDIRNFDPRFSRLEDANSSRMHAVTLRRRDVEQPVRIKLSELNVPDWWVQMFNLPREYNQPSLDNATSLSIGIPGELTGQHHELQLRRLALKGELISDDRVYLGILLAWLFGACAMVLRGWQRLRLSHRRQQREIDALTARTRQLRIEQENLRRLATVDELTGVLNRRGLEQSLDDMEEAAQGMSLVLLDIDHFKHVNDRHGHDCGDEVLRRVAAIVAANLRASDVIGRWGGEEFLIACQGTRVRDAARLAEKLRERVLQSEVSCTAGRLAITASFGVALSPPGGSAANALKRADEALYRAKGAGRNRVEIDRTLQSDSPTTV